MTEERPGVDQRSWLEKLSQAITGEPSYRSELVELLRSAAQRNLLDEEVLRHLVVLSEGELPTPNSSVVSARPGGSNDGRRGDEGDDE